MSKTGKSPLIVLVLSGTVLLSGCATTAPLHYSNPNYERPVVAGAVLQSYALDRELEDKILALDPENIDENQIREVLSKAPAPRVLNIHGGIYPVYLLMTSFSNFLIGMGYPQEKVRDPKTGNYSYSCYDDSRKVVGLVAWYYEHEAMRPMIVGHSQGGIQVVKILHELAGTFGPKMRVWNPMTRTMEARTEVLDPFTGQMRPVVGTEVSYATAVGAGGLTRVLPNQWLMEDKLRIIPDTVEEFTGFYLQLDILGGDFLGFTGANQYASKGKAAVRNVLLPLGYEHVTVPETQHLPIDPEVRRWINAYQPTSNTPKLTGKFKSSTRNILWAAEVWHSVKKHWCLEAQRLIRAKRQMANTA